MATTAASSATSTSNIDVNSIVSQLMTVERQPITKLTAKEASYQAKLSAYGTVKGAVSSFQSAVQNLSSASQFQSVKATPSDATVLSASASSIAVAGTYSLEVTSLAQAQKLAAAGQSSSIAAIGAAATSTLTFDFGTITGNTFDATTGKYGTTLTGAVTTNLSTTVTVSSTANLAVGASISGTGIPAGATIASITDATHFTLSAAATASGTVNLQAGATFTSNGNGTKSVTINSSNNSLQGIRDAINAAKIGVTATIVNDGSSAPYRLVLSSDGNGVSNSMKITVSGDAAVSGLLAHDPAGLPAAQNLSQTVTAQNANFKVNGVAVSKASNTVSDVVQGVTLTLSKVTASPVTLTVAQDTASIGSSISGFVKAYNDLAATLKSVSAYDAVSQKGAILQGDATVRSLQSQIRSMLNTPVAGTTGVLTTLTDVGVSFQKDGTLALNQTKLDSVMASNFSDIASLFAAVGKGTDSLVSFNNAIGGSTKPGNYAVNITKIATQGKTVGSTAITTPLTITGGVNDTLNLAVNGISAPVTLTAGTYNTAQALATELQTKINGVAALSGMGVSVAVSENAGKLTITSVNYGSTSSVSVTGGTAQAALGLTTTTPTNGEDVAGSIGGVTATGSGQLLSAISGDALGLSITVNGGALGARGTMNYSNGYAYLLDKWATASLSSSGILASRTDGIGKTITDIGKQRTALEARLVNVEKRYRTQFTALDVALTSMNTTSTYLTQQLNQLSKL